jgi:hypothetical protein
MRLQEAKLIANKKGYTELSTQKAGTYFTTSALKEHASDFMDLQQSYAKAQTGLVKEIVEIAGAFGRAAGSARRVDLTFQPSLSLKPQHLTSPFSRTSTRQLPSSTSSSGALATALLHRSPEVVACTGR